MPPLVFQVYYNPLSKPRSNCLQSHCFEAESALCRAPSATFIYYIRRTASRSPLFLDFGKYTKKILKNQVFLIAFVNK